MTGAPAFFEGFIPEGSLAQGAPATPPASNPGDQNPQVPPQVGDQASHLNPWDAPSTTEPEATQQPVQQPAQPAAPAQPSQTIGQMIESMGLDSDFDVNAIAAEMQVAPESLQKLHAGFRSGLQNTFLQSMQLMKKMVDSMESRVANKVSTTTQSDLRSDTAQMILEAKLPLVKDPAMAPVGRAVLAGFMQQDGSIESAVEKTVKYFQNLHGSLGEQFKQGPSNPRNLPGGFGGPETQQRQSRAADANVDWHAFFGVEE